MDVYWTIYDGWGYECYVYMVSGFVQEIAIYKQSSVSIASLATL